MSSEANPPLKHYNRTADTIFAVHILLFFKAAYTAADPSGVVGGFSLQFRKQWLVNLSSNSIAL
jgi:hypothetical protein